VLDDGKITEDGSHTTLLKKKGMYAALWKRQSGGFIEE
jgi:ATP-binding cassette subfamily B multidrug efflux pump